MTTAADPRSTLRSAFHMQALLFAMLASAVGLFCIFGYSSETALALGTLCSVAAYVLCLWSFYFSFRAARAGLSWRKSRIIWALIALELLAPAAYYALAGLKVRDDSLFVVLSLCVGGPLLVVLELYVLIVAVFTRGWKHRVHINVLTSFALMALLLTVLPAATLILAVLNNNPVTDRTSARTVITAIPEVFQDRVDLLLRNRGPGAENWRHLLSWRGMLSHERLMEILQDRSRPGLATFTWYQLSEFRKGDKLEIALDIAYGRIAPLAVDNDNNDCGWLIARNVPRAELVTILNRGSVLNKDVLEGILSALAASPDWPLEYLTMHRLCTGREVLLATKTSLEKLELDQYGIDTRDLRMLKDLKLLKSEEEIYFDWQLLKEKNLADTHSWSRLVKTCRQNSSSSLRRLSAIALADLLKLETHHIPFADAMTPDGKPVPVTLDESEELEQLCNTAQGEADKLGK